MIRDNRVSLEEGDIPYNFVHGKRVARIFLSPAQRKQVVQGVLAIAASDGKYELIPSQIAEKIRIRNEKIIVVCNHSQQRDGEGDSSYREFEVPDDLMW